MQGNTTYNPAISSSPSNSLEYAINQKLLTVNTVLPCRIEAINGDRYTVQILINFIDSTGKPFQAPSIPDVPATVKQGGGAGVIIEYAVGDAVAVGFSQRDISIVKQQWAISNPGSYRKFSISDAIIIDRLTNELPTIFVKITSAGIEITAPDLPITANCQTCTINADESATINSPQINLGDAATNKVLLENIPITATITNVQAGTDTVTTLFTAATGGSSVVKALP
jgi:hypothetical protein